MTDAQQINFDFVKLIVLKYVAFDLSFFHFCWPAFKYLVTNLFTRPIGIEEAQFVFFF